LEPNTDSKDRSLSHRNSLLLLCFKTLGGAKRKRAFTQALNSVLNDPSIGPDLHPLQSSQANVKLTLYSTSEATPSPSHNLAKMQFKLVSSITLAIACLSFVMALPVDVALTSRDTVDARGIEIGQWWPHSADEAVVPRGIEIGQWWPHSADEAVVPRGIEVGQWWPHSADTVVGSANSEDA